MKNRLAFQNYRSATGEMRRDAGCESEDMEKRMKA